ncbi:MAG: Ig-like domain-containing protein, partial [Desulfovibrio sp.]|nr:Ig-like domain-containing protein [Desulfovibrio sp.]
SYSPSDAGNVDIVWSSSDESVAVVDQNGHVSAVGKGSAVIKASTLDGKVFGSCEVTVQQPVTSISVNPVAAGMWIGDSNVFTVTLRPADANNLNYSATVTGDNDVVSISKSGDKVTVKALKVGKAKIQFVPELTLSSGMKAECEISVRAHVSSVAVVGGDHSVEVPRPLPSSSSASWPCSSAGSCRRSCWPLPST